MININLYKHNLYNWKFNSMSYSRQDIQNIITRNKKKNHTSKSPSPPLSPKSIQANRSGSPKDMAIRYQELCAKYKTLLEEVKDKNLQFQLQQNQLQRLRLQKERDQKQLYRLRSMIGFIKKEDKGLQINMDMQSGGSWSTKIEKSTTIQYQQDADWNTPVKPNDSAKLLRRISPNSKQLNSTANHKNGFKTLNVYESQAEQDFSRLKSESIYSPKTAQKPLTTFFKPKESREFESKLNKLSNSPYSKLRFSRKMDNLN